MSNSMNIAVRLFARQFQHKAPCTHMSVSNSKIVCSMPQASKRATVCLSRTCQQPIPYHTVGVVSSHAIELRIASATSPVIEGPGEIVPEPVGFFEHFGEFIFGGVIGFRGFKTFGSVSLMKFNTSFVFDFGNKRVTNKMKFFLIHFFCNSIRKMH